MPKLNLIKGHNLSLKPADSQAERYLTKLAFGSEVTCQIRQPRNPKFHRKFFSLLQLVFDNQERYKDFEQFRDEIVMRAGYFEEHKHLTGKVSYRAKSLAYDSMDDIEFSQLYDACCEVIIQYFWNDITQAEIDEAVMDYMQEYSP